MISKFPGDGINFISKLQSHCANMTFAEKRRYGRPFHQVTNKIWQLSMNYIKIFQNTRALSISVGSSYSEDQLMHIFLDNFHLSGKYTAHITRHQADLRKEEKFTDQKYSSITFPQTDYLNLDSISGSGRNN